MNWQPIETAPNDERPVLVYVPGERPVFEAIVTSEGWFYDPT
jgi:hypothetical protein